MKFPKLTRFVAILWLAGLAAEAAPQPLTRVHAHNDYEHERPLLDALAHGFCSVEADIQLVNGKLLVAHNRFETKPARTLQALYLDPLLERARKNGGRVFPGGPEVDLLIDIKDDWRESYPVLREVLKSYAGMLSTFRDDRKEPRAVMVIITGNRSPDMFAGETVRYAALDGSLADLDSSVSPNLIPWISSNWSATFKWRGTGPLPPAEKARVREIVAKAHTHGRRVRFWGSPDKPVFWQEMFDDDVDLINTDNLGGVEEFLARKGVEQSGMHTGTQAK